jgi:CheY-like chemotaxis protein
MNGYDAARAIRALPRPDAKTIPIIAMTANAYKEDVEAAILSGMNGHLAKPIDMTEVLRTLSDFLG